MIIWAPPWHFFQSNSWSQPMLQPSTGVKWSFHMGVSDNCVPPNGYSNRKYDDKPWDSGGILFSNKPKLDLKCGAHAWIILTFSLSARDRITSLAFHLKCPKSVSCSLATAASWLLSSENMILLARLSSGYESHTWPYSAWIVFNCGPNLSGSICFSRFKSIYLPLSISIYLLRIDMYFLSMIWYIYIHITNIYNILYII